MVWRWGHWGARLTVPCSSVTPREMTCCCLQWRGKRPRLSPALASLLGEVTACSPGRGRVLKRQRKRARPLEASAWEWHNIVFALSYWPKQITRQAIFRSAEMDYFFHGMNCAVSCKGPAWREGWRIVVFCNLPWPITSMLSFNMDYIYDSIRNASFYKLVAFI